MKTFFVPGHITGFFEIREHDDLLKTGSRGCGVVLDQGVSTGVALRDADETTVKVFYDGEECSCPTTRTVVREMLRHTCGAYEVEVHHFPDLPVEYGFGLSGAGALGAARALNHALGLELDEKRLGEIAHIAEVRNRTGLGDVIAEMSRGMVIRTREGAPGRGRIKSISLDCHVVCFIVGRRLRTKTVLGDRTKKLAINVIGRECVKEIVRHPTRERFMALSRRFAIETGIPQRKVEQAIKTLEKAGIVAAMAMLGHAVFTLTDEPEEVAGLLPYPALVAKTLQ